MEKNQPTVVTRVRRVAVAVAAGVAVAIDFHGDPWFYFTYFTILTNLAIGVWFLGAAFLDRRFETASAVRLALTVYGLVTVTVYWIFLSPTHHPQGWSFFANALLHVAVPLAMAAEGLVVPGTRIRPSAPWWGLLFPAVYCAFSLVRGELTGWYPYFFLNRSEMGGWGPLALFCGGLLAAFVALGFGWRALVHFRQRKATAT